MMMDYILGIVETVFYMLGIITFCISIFWLFPYIKKYVTRFNDE